MVDDKLTGYDRAKLDTAMDHLAAAHARISQAVTAIEGIDEQEPEPDFTISCPECRHEFDPARTSHVIIGPHTARYSCHNCSHTVTGPPPNPDRDRDDE
jgi:hypothetical protein